MKRSWLIAYFSMISAFFLVGLIVGGVNTGLYASSTFVIGTAFGFRWSEEHRRG